MHFFPNPFAFFQILNKTYTIYMLKGTLEATFCFVFLLSVCNSIKDSNGYYGSSYKSEGTGVLLNADQQLQIALEEVVQSFILKFFEFITL